MAVLVPVDGLVRAPLDAGAAAFAVSGIDVDPFVTDIGNVITRQSALGISHQPIYFFFFADAHHGGVHPGEGR